MTQRMIPTASCREGQRGSFFFGTLVIRRNVGDEEEFAVHPKDLLE